MLNSSVLVLNQNYEPLNVCNLKRAVVLLWRGKAEVLENGSGVIRSASSFLPRPSVIRLVYLIKRPRPQRKLTRREVFIRDQYTCQYCGRQTHDLTIDHVIPRHRGGQHQWENVVSACAACNRRKAGRLPLEAGMKPLRQPAPPHITSYYIVRQHIEGHREWMKYIPEWAS